MGEAKRRKLLDPNYIDGREEARKRGRLRERLLKAMRLGYAMEPDKELYWKRWRLLHESFQDQEC
jgi:hypothetical protein